MKIYKILYLSFLFILFSCDGFNEEIVPISVNVEDVESILVINGEIEEEKIAWVQISYSEDIDASISSPINYEINASVSIERSDGSSAPSATKILIGSLVSVLWSRNRKTARNVSHQDSSKLRPTQWSCRCPRPQSDNSCRGWTSTMALLSIWSFEYLDKIVEINQAPIGRTPRSNPATYTGAFTPIREWFSNLPQSRERGYKVGRFSFNVKGGRCESCQGMGLVKVEMHFLPDMYVVCDDCQGKRFNRETLQIYYKDKNINDILKLSIEEASVFFQNHKAIQRKLTTLMSVGLGYIQLGQQATTLSGGESQRIKLSKELSKIYTGRTLYILDEPTTGLHFADIQLLLNVLHELTNKGNTVLVIEHNLDVIKTSDWIIDLGPEGGDNGGNVIACGTPEDIIEIKESYTGTSLKKVLKN